MMVSMNASTPNFAAVQTNAKAGPHKVAQMQAQANEVKMLADALEAPSSQKVKTKAPHTGLKLDLHA